MFLPGLLGNAAQARFVPENGPVMPTPETALTIIDMQQCMADPATPPRNNPDAEANIARLLATWRAALRPIVHVRHISRDPASGFRPGQPGVLFQDAFLPAAGEHVVDKHVTDAFAGSGLERFLRVRSIGSLVVVGVATNYSVEATVRAAACLGFSVTLVSDACFTFDRPDLDGRPRRADDIHRVSLANLAGEYATVCTAEEVLAG
ncbi:cysteine hydrolase family protein [Allosphingosinicella deserti]|nr:cysteine hydrolase family protein [Sphingomonas deserti]